MSRLLLAFLLLLIPARAVFAAPSAEGRHYKAQLVAETMSAKPGAAFHMALVVTPQKGWHIYWSNPGESGYAPGLDWTLPKGMTAGKVQHPVPQLMSLSGIVSNVHEGETILLQDLTVPASAKAGSLLNLALDLDMLVCSESRCVPDPLSLDLTTEVGNGAINPDGAALFARARAKLPVPLAKAAEFKVAGGHIRAFLPGVSLKAGDKAHLFAGKDMVVKEDAPEAFAAAEGGLLATLTKGDVPAGDSFGGVLRIDGANGTRAYSFSAAPVKTLPAAVTAPKAAALGAGFFATLGAAILGGLILNLMPCVFPILSLKALALVRAGGDDREARVEAIGYSAGSIGVILALGATLLILRSGGQALGWAFQLQDTRVVILLLLLVTGIATNLAGLFELPALNVAGSGKSGFMGSMSTGALAAFIATPCTGPFMAGALGAAMLLPPLAAMSIFFGLGFGLALPFLALGFIKPMRAWLPKPGAWMQKLRQILSIPMFATALGLAWIIGRQGGVNLMAGALAAALLFSLGLWWYGMRQFSDKKSWPVLVPVLGALILSVNLTGSVMPEAQAATGKEDMAAVPFSATKLADLRAEKKPVFLYMTADWCLSCKVNEATSLSSATVAKAFDKAGVTVMRGDWTKGDPAITAFLKTQGSAGVPLYLWYPAGGQPKKLPQVLTPTMLTSLVS
ncbi:protein-disulfide reductase DsbD family protein [Kordiimonas marina]|uniref:protein-disulfide reductase DsbD family protein n=1 Tax=Kordiimonas marina TaxID=2872312 RepID=UPI001FF2FC75|nr:thioredoxin family protein [Kordiimonas marina]MCJ9430093.1 thioredoxin family protein [Kordiimonas marina]